MLTVHRNIPKRLSWDGAETMNTRGELSLIFLESRPRTPSRLDIRGNSFGDSFNKPMYQE